MQVLAGLLQYSVGNSLGATLSVGGSCFLINELREVPSLPRILLETLRMNGDCWTESNRDSLICQQVLAAWEDKTERPKESKP